MNTASYITLIVGDEPASEHRFDFEWPEVNIGRTASMELQIEMPTVSGHHARISLRDGIYMLEDMHSSNGTFLNGQQVQDMLVALNHGDQILLGQAISLFFEVSQGTPPAGGLWEAEVVPTLLEAAGTTPPTQTPPRLNVIIAGQQTVSFDLITDTVTIGLAPDNDITIESSIASLYQARLESTGRGFRLVPLPGVATPVMFDGQPLQEPLQLRDNDTMHIGGQDPSTAITLVYQTEPEATVSEIDAQAMGKRKLEININTAQAQQDVADIVENTFFRVLKNDVQRMREEMRDDSGDS